MILAAQSIRRLCSGDRPMLSPFSERAVSNGMTYGLSPSGYDIRIAETVVLPPQGFAIASAIERFCVPNDIMPMVKDKSSWARRGLSVFNTVAEAGWEGFLTLELVNHSSHDLAIDAGSPIAQVVFCFLDRPTEIPYRGRYQNQEPGPQPAREAMSGVDQ